MAITKLVTDSLGAGVGGKVLQVVSTTLTTHFSGASATFADVTGLSLSITPSSASNKILILCDQKCQADGGYAKTRIMRDSTAIYVGTAPSSRIPSNWGTFAQGDPHYTVLMVTGGTSTFLDSPNTTSSITYKLQYQTGSTFRLNTNGGTSDDVNHPSMASSITAIEIAG
jgi:hypothetical protein